MFVPRWLLLVAALWFWHTPWLWPLKVLVVLFHELGHASVGVLTGGTLVRLDLDPNQAGAAHVRGGSHLLVLNAGYLGSLIWGLALLRASRSPSVARWVTALLGALLLWIAARYTTEPFAMAYGLLAGGVLLGIARLGGRAAAANTLTGVGLFSVLYALIDLRDDVLLGSSPASDAAQLSALTGIPTIIWGVAWLLLGVGLVWRTRRWWL